MKRGNVGVTPNLDKKAPKSATLDKKYDPLTDSLAYWGKVWSY